MATTTIASRRQATAGISQFSLPSPSSSDIPSTRYPCHLPPIISPNRNDSRVGPHEATAAAPSTAATPTTSSSSPNATPFSQPLAQPSSTTRLSCRHGLMGGRWQGYRVLGMSDDDGAGSEKWARFGAAPLLEARVVMFSITPAITLWFGGSSVGGGGSRNGSRPRSGRSDDDGQGWSRSGG